MAKQIMLKNVKRFRTAFLAVAALGFVAGPCVWAQEIPEELPPTEAQSSDPAYAAQQEREQFVKEIRRVENLNRKYTKQIEEVKEMLAAKDADFQKRMKDLEDKLAQEKDDQSKKSLVQEQEAQTTKELESKTTEMLYKSGDLASDDAQFKDELAKAHYNMGNIYYERGEYQRAVVEYFQAVDLAPNDPDVHYNLAFVSGDYLGDQETALKHYQYYLYLKPKAEDINLINEKIAQAKLHLRGGVNSPLDKTEGQYNLVR